MKNKKEIIITENVEKSFGNFQALKGITATVKESEVVVVFGPSGSGKSTYIRTLNRLESHDSGRIIIDGVELNDDVKNLEKVRSNVGMVFQSFNLFPHLSILGNITLAPRKVKRMKKKEADDLAMGLLERVGIPEQAEKFPTQLSGGQQQRVAIARALAMQPKIMLFDEPTSALDPKGTEALEQMIWALSGQYTILIVTHNMAQARRASTESAFMLLGKLIEKQSTDDLFLNPLHEETADYIEGRYG